MPSITGNGIADVVIFVALLLASVIPHEVAHGWVADRLGDPTARRQGRLTLNPVPHIDPLGSVLLPGLLALSGSGVIFGWAKPVPVNARAFRRATRDMAVVALAGPFTNLAFAIIGGRLALGATSGTVRLVVLSFVVINVVLAVFNLLPIPPLDGSRLVPLFLPPRGREVFRSLEPYGFLILFGLFFLLPGGLSFLSPIVGWVLGWVFP